jgi:glycosyltransferase involved in cell wall biosynthesis
VALELAGQRGIDSVQPARSGHGKALIRQLTAVVKTFERPRALERLIASMKRLYPELKTIVVDDSRDPAPIPGVSTIALRYDSGVSAGRSEGLRNVATQYVLSLDDDFVFYRHTNLEAALTLMERHPEIDIMGGEVVHLPFFATTDYSLATLFPTATPSTMAAGSYIGGLPVYDKVANFFIGRADRIRLVDWDPALKRVEHADFFTRAKGVLTSVFNADLRCLHAGTPFDSAYMKKRTDYTTDAVVLRRRYYGD